MNIRKNIVITLIFVLASMVLCGCRTQAQLPAGPVYFVDNNGKSIEHVLIIPNYTTFSGISKWASHDPTTSKGRIGISFANPFIYNSDGEPFKVKQPLSIAFVIPFYLTIVHKSIILDGIEAYAEGYKIEWIPIRLLDKPRPATFRLEPLGEAESKEQFARISDGLRNKNFEVLSTYPPMGEDEFLKFDFSRKELKMMQDFFAAAPETESIN